EPSSTTSTYTHPVKRDNTYEPNETFIVNLSNATNATVADAQSIGTIVNDETAPAPTLTMNTTTVTAGGAISFTLADGPANPTDWVGLFAVGATDRVFVDWMYLNGMKVAPATGLSSANLQFTAPSTPGTYEVRL